MKPITILLLLVSLYSSGQTKRQVRRTVDSASATSVIIEVALKDKASARFFYPCVKIGNQYYMPKRRMKLIPKNWFVWSVREVPNA